MSPSSPEDDVIRPDTALLAALRSAVLLPPALTIDHAVLKVVQPFESGELLLELPPMVALTKDSAQDTTLLSYLDPEDGRQPPSMPHWTALPDDFVLALQLLLQVVGDGRGPLWAAWLQLAPLQLNGTAHWDEAEREWLSGSYMEEHALLAPLPHYALLRALRAQDTHLFDAATFSDAALDAAAALVRAHSLVPPQSGRPLLLPLPHMRLQHEGAASLELAADGRLRIRAQRALAAGAELTLEAAAFGHAALMLRQGTPGDGGGAPTTFSDAAAGHERAGPGAVPLSLLLGEDDPLHAVKSVLLSKLGLRPEGETFELRQGMPPPQRLMAYARLLVLEASAPQPNTPPLRHTARRPSPSSPWLCRNTTCICWPDPSCCTRPWAPPTSIMRSGSSLCEWRRALPHTPRPSTRTNTRCGKPWPPPLLFRAA